MLHNLALSATMVCFTVVVHFTGLLLLLRLLRHRAYRFHTQESVVGQGALIVSVVIGIFIIHAIEIWSYAAVFDIIGAIKDFEQSLYFSTVNFTTLGYGDITLSREWRLFAAIEGANGLVLIGWSTAFLMSVTSRMRTLEHDWPERGESL